MNPAYALGIDYGTNSVRALIVDTRTGEEIGTAVSDYRHGDKGVVLDAKDPNLARQHPQDYIDGMLEAVAGALAQAAGHEGFSPEAICGIGVDTTGSTPIPVDARLRPLALDPRFDAEPAAMAWLWKDHTSHADAAEITARAKEEHPEYLAKCGGTYSSEWFWSKMLHCARTAPEVFAAAHTWVEHADWMPALLCGVDDPAAMKRGACAAGHKGMFHPSWGGYPDAAFLGALDPGLARVRATLPDKVYSIAQSAGGLSAEWAAKLGLREGTPVAVGAIDAHLGAVGSGIGTGTLVKIMGTATCDIMTAPLEQGLPDIPGLCGIAVESVLPGCYGLEAGQAAVGDIFNWFVERIQPGGQGHDALTEDAAQLLPGESGLLALDWHNGNRTVLIDQRLTGMLVGMTLHTKPAEIYRALVEATAFGARAIIERLVEYDVPVERVVCCGGISAKNRMVMQIYADILGRPMELSGSAQTCALGAAMAGAVASGVHPDFAAAAAAMTRTHPDRFEPIAENQVVYEQLYLLYRQLHDLFGPVDYAANPAPLMKHLLEIKEAAKAVRG